MSSIFYAKKQAETIAESAILWYNICMTRNKYNQEYYAPIQMKIPVDLEKIIEISDPIYTFNEIMDKVDLKKYLVAEARLVAQDLTQYAMFLDMYIY